VVPTAARLTGPQSSFMFDLGTPFITNAVSHGTVPALSQSFEVVVTHSISANGARFYRIRRELCCH
jgi:hypothetical protein